MTRVMPPNDGDAAADKAMADAIQALEAARPASGLRPKSDNEWQKLVAANVKLSYAMYLGLGVPEKKARALAHITHGGFAGRLLLQMSFDADEARHG